MVNKKLIAFAIVTLLMFVIVLLPKVEACYLGDTSYSSTCNEAYPCIQALDCLSATTTTALKFKADTGGCAMGCDAGQFYPVAGGAACAPAPPSGSTCYCFVSTAYKSCSSYGESCTVKSGSTCETSFSGKYDSDGCITCSGNRQVSKAVCEGGYKVDFDFECESVCGADSKCDEKAQDSTTCTVSSNILKVGSCSSTCSYSETSYTCGTTTSCTPQSCGGSSYYCSYDGSSWAWRTAVSTEVCTDAIDNDCDGKIDCQDSDCARPSCANKVIATCDDQPPSPTYQWKCAPTCTANDRCEAGYCCVDNPTGVTSPNTGTGECKLKASIVNSKYLCDPPEWNSEETSSEEKSTSIVEVIWNSIMNLLKS